LADGPLRYRRARCSRSGWSWQPPGCETGPSTTTYTQDVW
jgi:hypothetical protein